MIVIDAVFIWSIAVFKFVLAPLHLCLPVVFLSGQSKHNPISVMEKKVSSPHVVQDQIL
jgi:hypothetical protein